MKKKNELDLFQKEIRIPEIVQKKADAAFEEIQREAAGKSGKTAVGHRRNMHRKRIAVLAVAASLAVCTISAGAVVYQKWSSGFEKRLHVTEEQRQEAENSGLADFPEMSVKNGDVTITAWQSIVDSSYAYLSFKVEGYVPEQGEEPRFDDICVQVDGKDVSWSGSFYDGYIPDHNGKAVRADGTELLTDEEGNLLADYTLEDGSMEYQIVLFSDGKKDAFLNKTIHVEIKDLGYYTEKAGGIEVEAEGDWSFDWTLKGGDSIYYAECEAPLGDTGAVVTGAEISPISIKVVYDFPRKEITETGYHEEQKEVDGELVQVSEPFDYTYYEEPPALTGVRLKDGTLLTGICMGAGMAGYADETSDQYVSSAAVDRILDVEEIQSLVFRKSYPEEGSESTEENFYIVDI